MAKVISFEKSILDLEAVVLQLEKGDLSLEDALKHYEQGIKLARTCQTTLSEAEKKIESLTAQSSTEGPSDHE
jgi:exodeoxyribonuclease VII small subunit